jgi:hypothetical protein
MNKTNENDNKPSPKPWRPLEDLKRIRELLNSTEDIKQTTEEAQKNNEAVLRPLLSSWDTLEKYLDGDSVLHLTSTCSAVHDHVHEAEGYIRPALPHILGHQPRTPKLTREKNGLYVEVKHSFLVLLMQPEEQNGEVRKVQIHFIYKYPVEASVLAKLVRRSHVSDNQETFRHYQQSQFRIEAYRYTSTQKSWEPIVVSPRTPVTCLMKQAITKCNRVLHSSPPTFPRCKKEAHKGNLRRRMDDYCRGTLELAAFRERQRLQEIRERERLQEMWIHDLRLGGMMQT